MFKVNDKVNYSTTGVCEITEIAAREFGGEKREFYILRPVFDSAATVMVPTDNEILTSRMRPLLSKAQIEQVVSLVCELEPLWYNDDRERYENYKKCLLSNDRKVLLSLIKALYIHQKSQVEKGRKLKNSDERTLREAEKILFSEIAFIMGGDPHEALKSVKGEILK